MDTKVINNKVSRKKILFVVVVVPQNLLFIFLNHFTIHYRLYIYWKWEEEAEVNKEEEDPLKETREDVVVEEIGKKK